MRVEMRGKDSLPRQREVENVHKFESLSRVSSIFWVCVDLFLCLFSKKKK